MEEKILQGMPREEAVPQEKFMTSIGGQALIEGVMMRGPETIAMAVRTPDGSITVEQDEAPEPKWYNKVPFLRGIFSMISSLLLGNKYLMRSADLAGMEEEEPSKLEKWVSDKFHFDIMNVVAVFAVITGFALAMVLFVVVPTTLADFLQKGLHFNNIVRTIIEGIFKMGIFIGYIALVAKMPMIRRVFEYHGAEHKTIACYEAGLDLTPDNILPMTRFHRRCGTSFILIVLVISILVFSFVPTTNNFLRIILKILFLPIVVGISYEIIRYAGRHDNLFTRVVSAPGLWMQRLTTKEPNREQIEVAIQSMLVAIPKESGVDHL